MAQVRRQPGALGQAVELPGQVQVVRGHPLGHGNIADQLTEQVQAGPDPGHGQVAGPLDGGGRIRAGHVPGGRPPGQPLAGRGAPHRPLQPLAGRQPEQDRAIDGHGVHPVEPGDHRATG
jgi:hypothetical protein